MKLEHLDEDGHACTRHAANLDAILTLAAIGSRVASFNHDIASKLQGLMMALDEIGDLIARDAAPDPDLRRAVETAQLSLAEASALLTANRALTRTSVRTKAALRDVVTAATERVGVALHGELPDGEVEAVVPLLVQGLGLALDAIAGTGRARTVDVAVTRDGARVELVFAAAGEPAKTVGDALALASFILAREHGELRCGRDHRLHVRLPLAG